MQTDSSFRFLAEIDGKPVGVEPTLEEAQARAKRGAPRTHNLVVTEMYLGDRPPRPSRSWVYYQSDVWTEQVPVGAAPLPASLRESL